LESGSTKSKAEIGKAEITNTKAEIGKAESGN
jgi:hypothetical protein